MHLGCQNENTKLPIKIKMTAPSSNMHSMRRPHRPTFHCLIAPKPQHPIDRFLQSKSPLKYMPLAQWAVT